MTVSDWLEKFYTIISRIVIWLDSYHLIDIGDTFISILDLLIVSIIASVLVTVFLARGSK